jgi:MFS family permease
MEDMTDVPPFEAPVLPEPTLGALAHDLSQQLPDLIRSEMRLAQAELTEKGKRAGLGLGMFGAAGILGLFGFGCLLATAILALAHAVPDWLAALIVTVVVLAAAGAVALVGKQKVAAATPAKPERAIEGLKEDVATVKGDNS